MNSVSCSLTLNDFRMTRPSEFEFVIAPFRAMLQRIPIAFKVFIFSSQEREMVKTASGSSRTRDSIYMHLDNIPAALRDVSNHWSPGCENPSERDRKSIKRRNRLKKSPCRVSSHKYNTAQPLNNSINENKNEVCER